MCATPSPTDDTRPYATIVKPTFFERTKEIIGLRDTEVSTKHVGFKVNRNILSILYFVNNKIKV